MLTPLDIDKKEFKSGLGYKKKEVDSFLSEVYESYNKLYKENIEYKDKLSVLNDGLQYYKSIEKTLQKALVLAQKTADDHHADAIKRAKTIEMEARIKADKVVQDAINELNKIKTKASELMNKYDVYKAQYKNLATSQLELLDGDSFNFSLSELNNVFLEGENMLADSLEIKEVKEEDEISLEESSASDEAAILRTIEIENLEVDIPVEKESEAVVDFHEE